MFDMQGSQGDLYHYVIPSLTGEPIEWKSTAEPDECKDQWMRLLTTLGVDDQHLKEFVLYVATEGNRWQPLLGQTDETVLVPVGIRVEEEVEYLELEFFRLGKQLVSAYRAMQVKQVELSRGIPSEQKKEFLADVQRKMKVIDAAISGTGELAKVFDLWVRKSFTKEKCARAMLMSPRTWHRRCGDVQVFLAKELTRNLSQSDIQAILSESAKK